MIYLIVGRTGSGKDYLAQKLAAKGLRLVKSYATRPKRNETEDTHIFISPKEAEKFTDKVAITKIGDYEYFATAEQVDSSDIYVIDPNGVDVLTKNMPDTEFQVVYVEADDDMNRRIHAVKRAEDKIREEEVFNQRDAAENEQFTRFEYKVHKQMDKEACFPPNINSVIIFTNDYTEDPVDQFVQQLVDRKTQIEHMAEFVKECLSLDVLHKSENLDSYGREMVSVFAERGKGKKKESFVRDYTIEKCAVRLLGDTKNLARIAGEYIFRSERFAPSKREDEADKSKTDPAENIQE